MRNQGLQSGEICTLQCKIPLNSTGGTPTVLASNPTGSTGTTAGFCVYVSHNKPINTIYLRGEGNYKDSSATRGSLEDFITIQSSTQETLLYYNNELKATKSLVSTSNFGSEIVMGAGLRQRGIIFIDFEIKNELGVTTTHIVPSIKNGVPILLDEITNTEIVMPEGCTLESIYEL